MPSDNSRIRLGGRTGQQLLKSVVGKPRLLPLTCPETDRWCGVFRWHTVFAATIWMRILCRGKVCLAQTIASIIDYIS